MKRRTSLLVLVSLLEALAGCSDDDNNGPPPDQGPGSEIVFSDKGTDSVDPDGPAPDGQLDGTAADGQPDGTAADGQPDGPAADGQPDSSSDGATDLKPEAFTLTISKKGNGDGTVTSTPSGIDCGAVCSDQIANGTIVTLHAAPASGSTFCTWMGSGVDPSCWEQLDCTVTVTKDTTVSAWFTTSGLCP